MIIDEPRAFLEALSLSTWPSDGPSIPKAFFLIEPSGFRISEQTATDNGYMNPKAAIDPQLALAQHRALAEHITQLGVPVVRFVGQSKTPDDLFCNNVWATTAHRLIVGSMRHEERRWEAERSDIRRFFSDVMGYELCDLSTEACMAELTGSLIIDRSRRFGFCGMSTRVDRAGLEFMHRAFDLAMSFCFELKPEEYHTNVVMSILASRALVICPDAFEDSHVPDAIAAAFPGHVVEIARGEKEAFVANCLAINDHDVMISQTAMDAMSSSTHQQLERLSFKLHPVAMDEIEKAGGSVRCCLGEIF